MNIFILDYNIKKNVRYYCDKHVVSQLKEYAQILSTVNRKKGLDEGYKSYNPNGRFVIWCEQDDSHIFYLRVLAGFLNSEYKYRFNKKENHKSYKIIKSLTPAGLFRMGDFTAPPVAVNGHDECIVPYNSVQTYRNYYKVKQNEMAMSWTKRDKPYWLEGK